MAKGVASGYAAIACLVTTEEVFNMFKDDAADPMNYFRDISTFGGCTAGPTAGIENMKIIEDENLLQNTTDMRHYMLDQLNALAVRLGQMQAQMLRDHLASHHIQSVVLGDYLTGGAGELSAINFPVLWLVEDGDLSRARQLLDTFLSDVPVAADWRCPACGAEVDGIFALCWQCNRPRPDEDTE